MQVIADLQLHSKYSRAVSPQMVIPQIYVWAKRKGIGLVATGDWTHPLWMKEIKTHLEETGTGLLKLRTEVANKNFDPARAGQNFDRSPYTEPLFLLATEVSCIYSQGGKGRRIHTLIWVPSLASADAINKQMTRQGCNLLSDGRPIIGLTSIQVAELVLTIEPKALIIPAHAWTPWFSVYGFMSGFNSIDEAFGPYAKHIYAVETGLSSNPAMNWRIKELDNRAIVSFSDAHSGPKIGREATVFDLPELSYTHIRAAIMRPHLLNTESGTVNTDKKQKKNQNSAFSIHDSKIVYTVEFYPEEGKYHWSGHRACNIRRGPKEISAKGTTCPVCGKPLTQGVEQRVGELAGRSEEELGVSRITYHVSRERTIEMTACRAFPNRPPFVMLVPLMEILSECLGSPVTSNKLQAPYQNLTSALGGEFGVLLQASIKEIEKIAGPRVAVGIEKVRKGDIVIDPGYDGVFGVVKLWREGEDKPLVDTTKEQLVIF